MAIAGSADASELILDQSVQGIKQQCTDGAPAAFRLM
jgi:hypothetical protein